MLLLRSSAWYRTRPRNIYYATANWMAGGASPFSATWRHTVHVPRPLLKRGHPHTHTRALAPSDPRSHAQTTMARADRASLLGVCLGVLVAMLLGSTKAQNIRELARNKKEMVSSHHEDLDQGSAVDGLGKNERYSKKCWHRCVGPRGIGRTCQARCRYSELAAQANFIRWFVWCVRYTHVRTEQRGRAPDRQTSKTGKPPSTTPPPRPRSQTRLR